MANMFPVSPAPHQDNTRPNQQHRPDVVFGPRGPVYNYRFGPKAHDPIGSAVGGLVKYLDHHGPLKNFGRNAIGLGNDIKSTFNPTTKAGLVNVLSMFAGGPKGDATPMMGKLGMEGQFHPYNGAPVNPLERGITNEGPNIGAKGASMRGLVRRAQGVGGYKTPRDPMTEIELTRAELAKKMQTQDQLKNFSNRANASRMIHKELGNKMGSTLVPGGGQPMRDYIDSLTTDGVPRAYKNGLVAYNGGNDILLSMLHEMLFGGANGLLRQPPKPTGGYPYGGGPFG